MQFPCQRSRTPVSRREFLGRWGNGMGMIAAAGMLSQTNALLAAADDNTATKPNGGGQAVGVQHHAARAKNVIFLYMDGGPSQIDTFDPKPRLTADNGKPFALPKEPTQFDNNGSVLGSPWKFNQYGQSGLWISDLFPNVAKHADKLCVIRSMTSEFSEHTSANYFLHTGAGIAGRPSMGAWMAYGLGKLSEDLPSFVVLNGGLTPPGGKDNFGAGFLPASNQASVFASEGALIPNLSAADQRAATRMMAKRSLLEQLDQSSLGRLGNQDPIESAIANYELAYRMQSSVPDVANLEGETAATIDMYGVNHANKPTAIFGRQCLLARRLVERGVRFIELTCPNLGHDRWDQHSNLKKGHEDNSLAVDQPIAALLEDLQQRGLLGETLVVWAGEFGRTPFAQGSNGRDHNPFAFSLWMAGGGMKGGQFYGETDEFGYKVVQNPLKIHDLHATILHLLGIDHERLTYRFGGRDMRLTDVHGHPLTNLMV